MSGFLEILSNVFTKIFEAVLEPILEEFLKFLINQLLDIIKKTLAWVFYYLFTLLLSVVNFLASVFDFFSGSGRGGLTYNNQTYSIVELFISLPPIVKMFTWMMGLAFALAIIFTIIQVIKSMSDMTLEDKNPISHVIKTALKTGVTFIAIPFLCIFLLNLSSILMNSFESSIQYSTNTTGVTIDRILWLNASLNAAKSDSMNVNSPNAVQGIGAGDSLRKPFAGGTYSYKYTDIQNNASLKSLFESSFDYAKFDYGLGIVGALVVIIVLGAAVITLIRRVLEILVLYIVGPLFASTMPLDDGEMFKRWKDMFIAKFFSSFGAVFAMRLFMVLSPIVCSNKLVLAPDNPMLNSFLQLLFIVGGAYAVYKMQSMITQLLSHEAAMAENENRGIVSSVLGTAKAAVNVSGAAFKKAASSKGK